MERQRLRLSDGRLLAYREYGAGAPVLFVPGAAAGSLMRFGEDLLVERGIRLVSVDRPGLGGSDPDPGKTLASVGADLGELQEWLGGPHPIVANSQGAPFALAAPARRVVLVSPADEVAHPPVTALLPEAVRELVASPSEAAFSGFTAESFAEFVLGGYPPSDAPVYGDPAFRKLFAAVLAEGFAQGPAGYARDTVLAMSPWHLRARAPVTVLIGADDDVHSPDGAATLTARLGADRTVVPGVGGSLLWARPDLVLDALQG